MRPSTFTRTDLAIPATSLAELAGRHNPAVLVAGKRLERRRLNLKNSRPKTHHHHRRFCRSLGTPPAGFYSSRHQHHFQPTLSPETAGLSTIGHLESSRLWELDPPPSSRVGGHRRDHWTNRGGSANENQPADYDDYKDTDGSLIARPSRSGYDEIIPLGAILLICDKIEL
ncbi:hypothetical protein CUMW_266720 [Citrus unshiu]|uniref:Uncharacterized protein n=1 Tax=Citrus unshiu TaxID=55188 RepID=A0A2H5QVW3_CITUN|nr:hypothetical protein CUMW_266720 [Citrus unshiu]